MDESSAVVLNGNGGALGEHRSGGPAARGECVVIADAEGTVRYVSTEFERLCGYSRYEILGKSVRDLRARRRDAEFFDAVRGVLESGKPWSGTFCASGAGGAARRGAATIVPVADASGAVSQCVAVRRDGAARGLAEEALCKARAMEAVARVAGGVAHHFNNLLTCVLGHCDLLRARVAGDAAARRSAEEIRAAGERAALLTRQLLAFSREQALVPRALDLNALVGVVGTVLREKWGNEIEIRTDLEGDLGTVAADPDQIEHAVVTLGVNARAAMPRGGRLIFATGNVRLDAPFVRDDVHVPAGDYVMLAVSDTGEGIDEGRRERIFEPFHVVGADGPGLDLAAVYGIVKQSGGYIWAFGRPGHGTTFEIYLPQVRSASREGIGRERAAPPPGANRLPGGVRHVRRIESRDALSAMAAGQEGP